MTVSLPSMHALLTVAHRAYLLPLITFPESWRLSVFVPQLQLPQPAKSVKSMTHEYEGEALNGAQGESTFRLILACSTSTAP